MPIGGEGEETGRTIQGIEARNSFRRIHSSQPRKLSGQDSVQYQGIAGRIAAGSAASFNTPSFKAAAFAVRVISPGSPVD
jgi:hypothetical protein